MGGQCSTIKIGNRLIGPNQPVYIIAEAGVNHNGDINLARQLIDAAHTAGADCIKFQTFKAERVVSSNAPKADYQLQSTSQDESQQEMLSRLELSYDEHRQLMAYCNELGIDFLSTPFNIEDIEFLNELGVNAFKIASGQVVEPYFLQAAARYGKPILLSTGMATMQEVEIAVKTIRQTGNNNIVLLQCTSCYPARPEDANLQALVTMADKFQTLVGYSDHTIGGVACNVAVALGAYVIEKHITLDKNLPGPDHAASANPQEFAQMVQSVRTAQKTLGNGIKRPCLTEQKNITIIRRSLVSRCDISAGTTITADMLIAKRPATGIIPLYIEDVIGKQARTDIPAETILSWEMLK